MKELRAFIAGSNERADLLGDNRRRAIIAIAERCQYLGGRCMLLITLRPVFDVGIDAQRTTTARLITSVCDVLAYILLCL